MLYCRACLDGKWLNQQGLTVCQTALPLAKGSEREEISFGNHKQGVKAHTGHQILFTSYNRFLPEMDRQAEVINLTSPWVLPRRWKLDVGGQAWSAPRKQAEPELSHGDAPCPSPAPLCLPGAARGTVQTAPQWHRRGLPAIGPTGFVGNSQV